MGGDKGVNEKEWGEEGEGRRELGRVRFEYVP